MTAATFGIFIIKGDASDYFYNWSIKNRTVAVIPLSNVKIKDLTPIPNPQWANLLAKGALIAAAREKCQLVSPEHVRMAASEIM